MQNVYISEARERDGAREQAGILTERLTGGEADKDRKWNATQEEELST